MGIIKGIDFGCFPGHILFVYGLTFDEFIDTLKSDDYDQEWRLCIEPEKEYFDQCNYVAAKRTYNDRQYFYIFIRERFTFTDYEYCKLAHEVLHICQFYLPDLLDRNREIEAEAYLHTHIMEKCLIGIRQGNEIIDLNDSVLSGNTKKYIRNVFD